jgi:hypothetical protein
MQTLGLKRFARGLLLALSCGLAGLASPIKAQLAGNVNGSTPSSELWTAIHISDGCYVLFHRGTDVAVLGGYLDPSLEVTASGRCGSNGLADGAVTIRAEFHPNSQPDRVRLQIEGSARNGIIQNDAAETVWNDRNGTGFRLDNPDPANAMHYIYRDGCEYSDDGGGNLVSVYVADCSLEGAQALAGQLAAAGLIGSNGATQAAAPRGAVATDPGPGGGPMLIIRQNDGTKCLTFEMRDLKLVKGSIGSDGRAGPDSWTYELVMTNNCGHAVVWYTEVIDTKQPAFTRHSSLGPFVYGGYGWPKWSLRDLPATLGFVPRETFADVPLRAGSTRSIFASQLVPDAVPVEVWIVSCNAYAADNVRAMTMFRPGPPMSSDGRFGCAENIKPIVHY